MTGAPAPTNQPTRALVVMPSWIGDAVMATPALRLLREARSGAFLGALCRAGVDEILDGCGLIDQVHRAPGSGIMAPKVSAQRVRMGSYAAAVLLTNSFSTALAIRLAGIPRRVGYDRDGRGALLTDRLAPLRRRDVPPFSDVKERAGDFAPISACDAYVRIVRFFVEGSDAADEPLERARRRAGPLTLGVSETQERAAQEWLSRAGVGPGERYAVLNPGGNDDAKRWPADRFADAACHLVRAHGMRVLVNGSPGEREVVDEVVRIASERLGGQGRAVALTGLGGSIGALKGLLRGARLLLTNDTGPRHIAVAFGVPTVALFGPTDHRWTDLSGYLPARRDGSSAPLERILVADPTLSPTEVADDHPERCRIDRIAVGQVVEAIDDMAV